MIYALLYILAIILANLSISYFGPISAPINGFLLIGAILTLRDHLHENYGPRVVVVLVPLGTLLSYLLGPDVGRIALAGMWAFLLSETADTGVYHLFRAKPWIRRVNYSNAVGALVDSVVFFPLAFGTFPLWLILSQFIAKFAGGFVWALVIDTIRERRARTFDGSHPGCDYQAYRTGVYFYCNKCGFHKRV